MPGEVDRAFAALRETWRQLLEKLQVETPDIHTNRMVNIWNAYQVMVTFNFSRSASYFESGIGRGMGFRDSAQDLLGFMHLIPERARERILDLAATQLPGGGAYHQYQPMTKLGNNDVGSGFNDDPLWLVLAVSAYLKETGDWSILDEPVVFDNKPGSQAPLYEHIRRSIQYTLDRLGPHGLPLIGRADWNDCLNLNCFSDTPGQSFQTTTARDGKVAESVFIGGLFVLAAGEMAEIAERSGKTRRCPDYRAEMKKMTERVETSGWDGEWFRRAYDHFGEPLGSKECAEGQIFIEPQGMCVTAGIGLADGKAKQALDSVGERLACEHGIVLLNPAYTSYQLRLGEISSYPPGYKENGSVFCHTNPWVMIAETRVGRGGESPGLLPSHQSLRSGGDERSTSLRAIRLCPDDLWQGGGNKPGEAKNSWLTGTAAWNYVAITQWILGIRPGYEGLILAPVIPDSWQGFKARRYFRGSYYNIEVRREGPGNHRRVMMDGKEIDGDQLPLPASWKNGCGSAGHSWVISAG